MNVLPNLRKTIWLVFYRNGLPRDIRHYIRKTYLKNLRCIKKLWVKKEDDNILNFSYVEKIGYYMHEYLLMEDSKWYKHGIEFRFDDSKHSLFQCFSWFNEKDKAVKSMLEMKNFAATSDMYLKDRDVKCSFHFITSDETDEIPFLKIY